MGKLIRGHSIRLQKVKHAGIIAGLKGRDSQSCPWEDSSKKAAWVEGWREGYENYKDGSFWIH